MTTKRASTGIAQFVRALRSQGCTEQTDGQLLSQFLAQRDEAAFVALVRRHGPMVLGVCRRVLGNVTDAEDAFQATFLVLVRKAASLRTRVVLGDWLHGVARRTALSARRECARRRTKEQAMARPDVQDEAIANDWLPLLDEELSRLPENYRLPLVLCELEGKTRREAAAQLGWPEGTVAGRLARGRALLARRLLRHGGAVSSSALAAVLAQNAASAGVSEGLLHSTTQAASLLAVGTGAATAVISAKVAALTDGVVRAMFVAKLKSLTCVLTLMVVVGLGGVALLPGGDRLPPASQPKADAKANPEAPKLVRQLGSPDFAKREAAEKALAGMGARAAAAVRAGMDDADLEIARRCADLWPRLWQTEIARKDADRLAGYTHPLWVRFRKVAGEDADSRTLFAEMVADGKRFRRLEAVEADPEKAGAAYAAELKERVEALGRGYEEAAAARGRERLGMIEPKSGLPTRREFVTVLFLGTYPATAREESIRDTSEDVFNRGLGVANTPACRRLYAAWLATRTDPRPIAMGLAQALNHKMPEVAPVAVAHAKNADLPPRARGFALLAVGLYGDPEHLPLLQKAFADSRVFHKTVYSKVEGKDQPVEVQVGDAALGAALWLWGQRAADFGFPLAVMYAHHPETLTTYYLLGFLDDATRRAVHQKAEAWLLAHKNDKPKRFEVKDWQPLFDGKTTKPWKTEGQVKVEDGILKIGGAKGGSIVTTASFGHGLLRWSYRQEGQAKATMTWRGEKHDLSAPQGGWVSEEYEPAATGETPIRLVAPPGTTLLIKEMAFRPY